VKRLLVLGEGELGATPIYTNLGNTLLTASRHLPLWESPSLPTAYHSHDQLAGFLVNEQRLYRYC
jgi:hypothetical protein